MIDQSKRAAEIDPENPYAQRRNHSAHRRIRKNENHYEYLIPVESLNRKALRVVVVRFDNLLEVVDDEIVYVHKIKFQIMERDPVFCIKYEYQGNVWDVAKESSEIPQPYFYFGDARPSGYLKPPRQFFLTITRLEQALEK